MSTRRRENDDPSLRELLDLSQRLTKRARMENGDDDVISSSSEGEGDSESDIGEPSELDAPLPADEDGYVQGSIVRIKLRNFVTYDYCEFNPGPQLNMIIGPNGTGKSTIVCAIALGLGGTPALLGRAKNIAEFVKTGEDEAMIQIELKRTGGRPNAVIQRTIQKSNNQSSWRLDGRPSPQNKVMSVISDLNVQVDNLCQFLPQDKVAEFAQLTPTSLLTKTQEAAGEKQLLQWQQQLIEWRNEERELQKSFDSDQEHIKSLKDRNQYLERDVLKMQQRAELLKRIALLEAQLPLARYTDAKREYDEAKEAEKEELERVKALEEELGPIKEVLQQTEQAKAEAEQHKRNLGKEVMEYSTRLTKISDAVKRSTAETRRTQDRIKTIHSQQEKRKQAIAQLEERIKRAKSNTGDEPPSKDTSEIDEAIAEIDQKETNIQVERNAAKRDRTELADRLKNNNIAIQKTQRDVKEANDRIQRRLALIREHLPDTAAALNWLRENRSMFKGKIHGPIGMNLNIKDTRYANLVESILGGIRGRHLKAFVCELKEDYELFTREVMDKQKLRVTAYWPKLNPNDLDVQAPMSNEDLRKKFGLDYFVHELLDGPQYVIKSLAQSCYINLVPVSLRQLDENRLAQSGVFQKFAMNDSIYEVKSYSFGQGGQQTNVRAIRRSEFFTDSLDNDRRHQLSSRLAELEQIKENLEGKIKDFEKNERHLNQKLEELRYARNEKKATKRDIQMARMRWEQMKAKIDEMEDELESKKAEPENSEDMIKKLKEEMTEQVKERAGLSARFMNTLKEHVNKITERNISELAVIQAAGKCTAAKEYSRNQTIVLEQAKQAYRQVASNCQQKRHRLQTFREGAERAGRNLEPELKEEFREIRNQWRENGCLEQSTYEIENEINSSKAKADTLKTNNPKALEQFEARKKEINILSEKIATSEAKLNSLKEKIHKVKNEWEPRLTAVVSKISDKFSEALQRIGCAGEVCVHQEEDFDKWGIEIRVKFRDNEKLQLLTGQRQSGGERAVSTILYLMALQNLARSPFRVVDEINQGMDPRNERMIHEQIVKGASKPGTAQYFLITPKLLPDLYYNERMRVLCIYNGEWQPKRLKPLTEYLKRARAAA
ncbi:p-loop containing nucleoside triphosphatehydrolase protein [Lichtheimia corymbifera JMRC:FSU:9682]|uniref:Structural maintenance of chromosomes protein 5 n=1 Tax=Lichtheimia corymbifera JMRC:FSU:9682 TaxID=1263082 RepID=A0A068RY67_9FUNG|nr:p-loop containing nucleoside triphosphatehydrolase protein [Lichtheimia corymbifera JMRC:FSU:9682]